VTGVAKIRGLEPEGVGEVLVEVGAAVERGEENLSTGKGILEGVENSVRVEGKADRVVGLGGIRLPNANPCRDGGASPETEGIPLAAK
jgi:hypothetical protein